MHNLKATIILFLLGGCLACHNKPSGVLCIGLRTLRFKVFFKS